MFFAVALCKILRLVGKTVGKGSSIPGKIVLKVFPNVLYKIKLPDVVIAVSGSNGKTSTVESIAHILSENGKKVIWNKEGSNQTEGVATTILCACDFRGNVKGDVLLLESDERYARLTFKYFAPTHFVITNLYRDQMTRNGHNELIYNILKDAIKDESTLILNADDPIVSAYGKNHEKTVYYGMDRNKYSSTEPRGRYNDSMFCPLCKKSLKFDYYTFENEGKFVCENCGHGAYTPKYRVSDVDLDDSCFEFDNKYKVSLRYKGLHNIYNYLSAYAVCCEIGLDGDKVASSLCDYVMHNGRLSEFELFGKKALLLISKHENSMSYNSSIDYSLRLNEKVDVMIMVNSISRKYYTGETSWLYDVDFERLNNDNVGKIILCGKYCYDLLLRFELGNITNKTVVVETPEEALRQTEDDNRRLVIMTCFADRARLSTAIENVSGEKKI